MLIRASQEDSSVGLTLLVVIVNFRTPDLAVECLRSLEPEVRTLSASKVVVVENGSGDDSASRLERALCENSWSWARLIVSERNLGFAGGNNLGIEQSPVAEFVLLLNSDTVVQPGCFQRCLAVMREDPAVGAMSCRLLNADGSVQNVARRFPSPLRVTAAAFGLPWRLPRWFEWADTEDGGWDRQHTARDVDWLGGAFLFIRSAALGGRVRLDDDFFFYGEDIAFSHRLMRRGWGRRYDPIATTIHFGGGSSDPSRMPSPDRGVHHWRGRYLVQKKCYGMAAAQWTRVLDLSLTGLRWAWARARGESGRARERDLRQQLERISAAWSKA